MCSNTEHVIELLHTLMTIGPATDMFPSAARIGRKTATYLEHMFDIHAKCATFVRMSDSDTPDADSDRARDQRNQG